MPDSAKLTKSQRLQALIDELQRPDQYRLWAEYVPRQGWFAQPDEPRWFGDPGEYLGRNYADAAQAIRRLLA